ncbi:MAG: hypothetical protein Q4C85_00510 [Actinomyces sp.]|uniref:hypothetical protein n=1 Tax=Actinomyces sp. TaxID=29317 RepID=UPI0026DD97E4|nr:hypothetical protein [Actinomyces sp.]MDO4242244.1 hypothetical protein [Actinomyces sp.]
MTGQDHDHRELASRDADLHDRVAAEQAEAVETGLAQRCAELAARVGALEAAGAVRASIIRDQAERIGRTDAELARVSARAGELESALAVREAQLAAIRSHPAVRVALKARRVVRRRPS